MADDSVRRTGSVPTMGGFAGHQGEESLQRRRQQPEAEAEARPRPDDEVTLHSDATAALRLLRERVLACTRERLGLGALHVPAFAEIVEGEAVGAFVSRLLSDQNQLVGHAPAGAGRQHERTASFGQGLVETRELLAEAGAEIGALLAAVEAEFGRRLAAL